MRSLRWGLALFAGTFVSGGLTLAVVLLPGLKFAYRAPSVHILVEAVASSVALLAAFLVLGRFLNSRRLDDLIRSSALLILGCSNLFLAAIPSALEGSNGSHFAVWAPLIGGLLGALVLAASAFTPRRIFARPRRALAVMLGTCCGAVAVVGVAVSLIGHRLPTALVSDLTPPTAPAFGSHPAILAAQAAAAAAFALAAVGFSRHGDKTGDELLYWFAGGAALLAFARVNYGLFPSNESEWVFTGDLFRSAAYLVISAGAVREIGAYWRRLSEAARQDERRLLALGLHGEVAQGLAALSLRLRLLAREESARQAADAIDELATLAQHALGDCIAVIEALRTPSGPLLEHACSEAGGDDGRKANSPALGAHVEYRSPATTVQP
ncbi:MAG: hypothetical protein E6G67_13255 [Actinobacteria bacterium]|nr:MAG: hypothetical protein E6G67_13255 [Actinomycetota bacterium]